MGESRRCLVDDPHRRRLSDGRGQDGLRRLVRKVAGDVEDRVLGRLPDRAEPVLGNAPAQQRVVALALEEPRLADRLLDIAADDHVLDRLADLHDLRGPGSRVPGEAAARRPVIGAVVMADIGQQDLRARLVQHDADVLVRASGQQHREPLGLL